MQCEASCFSGGALRTFQPAKFPRNPKERIPNEQCHIHHKRQAPPTSSPTRCTARSLLGPGPSNAHPRVLQALGMRQIGHLDPQFISLMNEIQELLRYAWQTDNPLTIPVSGTGSAAMEASLANSVEPGDVVLIGVNGYFGERLVMAGRYGADVRRIDKPWGEVFSLQERCVPRWPNTTRPCWPLVHAETSTGARANH